MLNYPRVFCLLSALILWLAAWLGSYLRRLRPMKEEDREDFGIVQTATLTLLGLIIGFCFSMAIARYDLRKTYEEAEANAIGTEYVRSGLLDASDAAQVRALLRKYTDLRVSFYQTRDDQELQRINADTSQLQTQMWSLVQARALAQPTPVVALAVSGMNDVLNSQGYTQAAWWNRIPDSTWTLLIAIAICCNILVGYGSKSAHTSRSLLLILPIVVAIAFLLIADVDSPRRGFVHVIPQNLVSLAQSFPSQATP